MKASTALRERRLTALRWLVFVRFVFIGVCALVPIFQKGWDTFFTPIRASERMVIYVLAIAFLLNIAYLFTLKKIHSLPRIILLQLILDVLAVSALVYGTGGLGTSSYVWLYFAVILAASIMFMGRMGILFASISVVLLSVITLAMQLNLSYDVLAARSWHNVGQGLLGEQDWGAFIAKIVGVGTAMLLVGALGDILVMRLSTAHVLTEEILQNMAGGLLVIDRDQKIAQFNQEALRLLGLPDTFLIGKEVEDALPSARLQPVREMIDAHKKATRELYLTHPDGVTVPVELKLSILKGTDGNYRGQILIIDDMTMRKRMEIALKNAERFESVSKVSAAIAHEIRNPLASLRGAAQELAAGRGGEDTRREMFQIIIDEADRLENIISDFLHYARMRPAQLRPCLLDEVLEEAVRILKKRPESEQFAIITNIQPGLNIMGDPEQLTQIFLNLGINAMETTPRATKINISAQKHSSEAPLMDFPSEIPAVLVQFQDNGAGISKDIEHKIYDPFFTTKEQGSGLGLSIVERIVRAHNGAVELQSPPDGIGAVFNIWLPLLVAESQNEES